LPVKELPLDWFKQIDPEIELEHIFEVKNVIKTIYEEELAALEAKS
jgi:hypothetical protein